jgi:hypothetical protein
VILNIRKEPIVSKVHPLPQIAIAPPYPVVHNPPPVRDTRPSQKAHAFTIPAIALIDPSAAVAANVPTELLHTVKSAFGDWLGEAKPTKRKAREFLSRFAGRTVAVR